MWTDDTDTDADRYAAGTRNCPRHPWVRTSSWGGLHDCPCGECEYAVEVGSEAFRAAPVALPVAPPPVVDPDDDLPF